MKNFLNLVLALLYSLSLARSVFLERSHGFSSVARYCTPRKIPMHARARARGSDGYIIPLCIPRLFCVLYRRRCRLLRVRAFFFSSLLLLPPLAVCFCSGKGCARYYALFIWTKGLCFATEREMHTAKFAENISVFVVNGGWNCADCCSNVMRIYGCEDEYRCNKRGCTFMRILLYYFYM